MLFPGPLTIFSPLLPGQVLSSLEGPPIGGRVPLRDLSITLDVFVLTLPLEVELPPASDPQHHRLAASLRGWGGGSGGALMGIGRPLKESKGT
jgi:hypothetical protein